MLSGYPGEYQIGQTRVFLRENLERQLERERSEILNKAALKVQTAVRGLSFFL